MALKTVLGPQKILNQQNLEPAHAQKVLGDVLCPADVITSDPSAAAVLVGQDNLLRIRVATGPIYVAFGPSSTMAAVTSATTPAVELFAAGVYLVACSDQYVRMSAAPARLERIKAE